jgi:hypothetical protein
VRRDLLYLAALVAIAALMFQLGTGVLVAVIIPAWFLRRGSLRPLRTAPLAVIALVASAVATLFVMVMRGGRSLLNA